MYKHKKIEKQTEISNYKDLFYVENSVQTDVAILTFSLKMFLHYCREKKRARKEY
ncbi:hypothetical protein GCM10022259_04620 [Aquimarina mytili]